MQCACVCNVMCVKQMFLLTKNLKLHANLIYQNLVNVNQFRKMAKSSFEYVKNFELDDTILPNTWMVIRLDGKCFHKFAEDHGFQKPNDLNALKLMNCAAYSVMKDIHDIIMAYGQSDEYSFVFKKNADLYKRRSAKLLTTVNSKFSSSYVYYWSKYCKQELLYPPTFDGRMVIYPSEENLIDYMKWRQADVHINNLYNTTFWKLVQLGNMTPNEAEKRLCGTVSSDKNEILFKEFNINYNNEPEIFKRGTLLRRMHLTVQDVNNKNIIVETHDDIIKDNFWKSNIEILSSKPKSIFNYNGPITEIIDMQIKCRGLRKDL